MLGSWPAAELLALLDLLFLCAFLAVGSTLMLVATINRQRVRGVVLSWLRPRHRPCWWAALAASAALLFLFVALQRGDAGHAVRLAGYAAGCGFFFVVAVVGGTTLATRRGLITNVNRRRGWRRSASAHELPWRAVRDYSARSTDSGDRHYVFFYVKEGTRRRFDVTVPAAHAEAFARLVHRRVDRRLDRRADAASRRADRSRRV